MALELFDTTQNIQLTWDHKKKPQLKVIVSKCVLPPSSFLSGSFCSSQSSSPNDEFPLEITCVCQSPRVAVVCRVKKKKSPPFHVFYQKVNYNLLLLCSMSRDFTSISFCCLLCTLGSSQQEEVKLEENGGEWGELCLSPLSPPLFLQNASLLLMSDRFLLSCNIARCFPSLI